MMLIRAAGIRRIRPADWADVPHPCALAPMTDSEAIDLLRPALPDAPGPCWADLGAGGGTFTRALAALLGADAEIHAVDRDERALRGLRTWAERAGAPVRVHCADLAQPLHLPPLDGVVMANALHFVADQAALLGRIAGCLRTGGRLVLIEYEGRRPGPWVPHPVSIARFGELAAGAGLTPPRVVATRRSAYGGELYVAAADRQSS
jgi:SAM-dependent methyltransferase